MKKKFAIFGIILVVFLVATVFAETISLDNQTKEFVKEVAHAKGIDKNKIEKVDEVDFKNLPQEVKIENLDTTNLAMYKLKIQSQDKPVYVITASEKKFQAMVRKFTRKMLLNFGYAGEFKESGFIKSAVGVVGSKEKGFVMIRDGSITGLSTNLEALSNKGQVDIIIYKNGQEIGFRNTIIINGEDIYSDYDEISDNTLNFHKGDVISIYVSLEGGARVKDINTLLEIATE